MKSESRPKEQQLSKRKSFLFKLGAFLYRSVNALMINTSFNVKDEPIVCWPADALRCFDTTEMDLLVMDCTMFSKV